MSDVQTKEQQSLFPSENKLKSSISSKIYIFYQIRIGFEIKNETLHLKIENFNFQ
jgi:hypothetical protein